MPGVLDDNTLRKLFSGSTNPRDTRNRMCRLCDLARWWVEPSVLRRWAGILCADGSNEWKRFEEEPRLRGEKGACWVVFANVDPVALPFLRPAFLIPFQWVKNADMDPYLPEGIAALATAIADDVDRERSQRWGLQRSKFDGFDRWDMSGLTTKQFPCDSGWASLAAGLYAAVEGGKPDPSVWASARWDPTSGIMNVGHLESKIALAAQFGVRQLFVAQPQIPAAWASVEAIGRVDLEIVALPSGLIAPRKALHEYLKALKVPPGMDDSSEERWAHYQTLFGNDADNYLRGNLLNDTVRECREKLMKQHGGTVPPIDCFVTIADNTTLILTAVKTLKPKCCILLHTPGRRERAREAVSAITRISGVETPPPIKFDDEISMLGMDSKLAELTKSFDASKVAFDVTPGTKLMTINIAKHLASGQNLLVYLKHERPDRTSRVSRWGRTYLIWQADRGFHG